MFTCSGVQGRGALESTFILDHIALLLFIHKGAKKNENPFKNVPVTM